MFQGRLDVMPGRFNGGVGRLDDDLTVTLVSPHQDIEVRRLFYLQHGNSLSNMGLWNIAVQAYFYKGEFF